MAQKLPDYPDAGGLSPAQAQEHLRQVNGSSNWGPNTSGYTKESTKVLGPDDAVRQRFVAQANRRTNSAVDRVPLLTSIVEGDFPSLDLSKSDMGHRSAERELSRVMFRSIEGQLGAQALQALQVLPADNPTKIKYLQILAQRLSAETDIRDNGPSEIATLPIGPA